MENDHDIVEELDVLSLEYFRDLNVVLKLNNTEDDIQLVSWNHNFKWTVTWVYIFIDDKRSKLSIAHLKQLTNPVNSLLELDCLDIIFGFGL